MHSVLRTERAKTKSYKKQTKNIITPYEGRDRKLGYHRVRSKSPLPSTFLAFNRGIDLTEYFRKKSAITE